MNSSSQLQDICIIQRHQLQDVLPFNDDPFDNKVLRPPTEIVENDQYATLNDPCFEYLFGIYGGTDVRRHSIKVEQINDDEE